MRPESPLPKIPDVTLHPELVEQDITRMRTNPEVVVTQNLQLESSSNQIMVSNLVEINNNNMDIQRTTIEDEKIKDISDIPSVPLVAFPCIPAVVNETKQVNTFPFQLPLRKYEPVSLTGKTYKLKEHTIIKPMEKPEYNFALADTAHKVIERTYSEGTSNNKRSLQSEIFESQGHFNASRSCSPFPVYIPVSRGHTPIPKDQNDMQIKDIPQPRSTEDDDIIEMPHLESNVEQHLRDSTITGNKTVSENIKSQQKCFSELRDIQFCYAMANGTTSEIKRDCKEFKQIAQVDENEIQKRLKEMKNIREGKCSDTLTETSALNTSITTSSSVIEKTADLKQFSNAETAKLETNSKTENKNSKDDLHSATTTNPNDDDTDVPKLLCKKPPDAIIGARPLFGQLDITSEFKKAIVGRSKSMQSRRSKVETIQRGNSESSSKAENLKYIETENITDDSKLSTQLRDTTKAEITKLQATACDEIEKIYFQQEREYEVDIQTAKENVNLTSFLKNVENPDHVEYFGPHSYAVADTNEASTKEFYSYRTNGISRSSPVCSNLNKGEEGTSCIAQKQEYFREGDEYEEYKKVPVKCLIQNFEQCSMPTMRYKQLRDPLPDVVYKLGNTKGQLIENTHEALINHNHISCKCENQMSIKATVEDFNLKKAEEEFDNLFYVANTSVRTQPYFPKMEIQNFQQSENSSFCKYSSLTNLSQHSSHSTQVANSAIASATIAAVQNPAAEFTQQGKLLCSCV